MADYRYGPRGRRERYFREDIKRDFPWDYDRHHHRHHPSCPERSDCDRYQRFPRGWRYDRYDD
ncbi:MAG: hypothetical protein K0R92_2004 [Lachnospiraceae bacterium]|nr:hypothetical protein [Lachnospiraceae bacterium]